MEVVRKIAIMHEYVKMVSKGYFHSLIVVGKPGIGKSYNVIKLLNDTGTPHEYHSGFRSPLSLYNYLFEHQNDLIVFDDTSGIMSNDTAISVLNAALWPVDGKRVVSWGSTTDMATVNRFEFKGQIIFLTNTIPKRSASVKSRCMIYKLELTNKEIIEFMRMIAKDDNGLTINERSMIVDFIEKNIKIDTEISFRVQEMVESMYKYDKTNWQILASSYLESKRTGDEKLIAIWDLMNSHNLPVSEQIEQWKMYGWSRRSFFLYKRKCKNAIVI